jgi:hypothetical protein
MLCFPELMIILDIFAYLALGRNDFYGNGIQEAKGASRFEMPLVLSWLYLFLKWFIWYWFGFVVIQIDLGIQAIPDFLSALAASRLACLTAGFRRSISRGIVAFILCCASENSKYNKQYNQCHKAEVDYVVHQFAP